MPEDQQTPYPPYSPPKRIWSGSPPAEWTLDAIGEIHFVDAEWQDQPRLRDEDIWVAVRAPSLIEQDLAPYPGIAVRTAASALITVSVEFTPPTDLDRVFATELTVGNRGNRGNRLGSGATRLTAGPADRGVERCGEAGPAKIGEQQSLRRRGRGAVRVRGGGLLTAGGLPRRRVPRGPPVPRAPSGGGEGGSAGCSAPAARPRGPRRDVGRCFPWSATRRRTGRRRRG